MGTWVLSLVKMRPLILLPITIFSYVFSQTDECCPKKIVGGKKYVLAGSEDTTQYKCTNNCVYNMVGDDKKNKYCFKPGSKESECMDDMTTGGMGGMTTGGMEQTTQGMGQTTQGMGQTTQGMGQTTGDM